MYYATGQGYRPGTMIASDQMGVSSYATQMGWYHQLDSIFRHTGFSLVVGRDYA